MDNSLLVNMQKRPHLLGPHFLMVTTKWSSRKILSPASEQPPDGKRKKRRAPLPPSDKPPFSLKAQSNSEQQTLEDNWGKTDVSRTSPLDTKLSTLMHHIQKPMAAPRKLLPAGRNSLPDSEQADTQTSCEAKPVPAPRQKSIKDILDPRSWLPVQKTFHAHSV